MALGRRVQAVDRLAGDVQRGIEPERHVGGAEVVVDRLRHADHVQPSACSRLAAPSVSSPPIAIRPSRPCRRMVSLTSLTPSSRL